jgi:hypothetical protein
MTFLCSHLTHCKPGEVEEVTAAGERKNYDSYAKSAGEKHAFSVLAPPIFMEY